MALPDGVQRIGEPVRRWARQQKRAPFTSFRGASGEAEIAEEVREHGGVKHAVGELLTCPFCLAQWVATGFVFGYATAPRATRLAALTMTLVAGSDVLQFAYDGIQNGALTPGDEDSGDDTPVPDPPG